MPLQKRRIMASLVVVGLIAVLAGCSTYGGYPGYYGNGYGAYGARSVHYDRSRTYSQPYYSSHGLGFGHRSSGGHNRGGHGGGGRRH